MDYLQLDVHKFRLWIIKLCTLILNNWKNNNKKTTKEKNAHNSNLCQMVINNIKYQFRIMFCQKQYNNNNNNNKSLKNNNKFQKNKTEILNDVVT